MLSVRWFFLICVLGFSCTTPPASDTVEHTKPRREYKASAPDLEDVSYGPHERQVLDVWHAESNDPAPVLVFFHGGGFIKGNKTLTELQKSCLETGITAVSANYRLAEPEGITVRDAMHDAARVIQFIRAHAKPWHIDPNRIAVTGGSAGGCISVWLALSDDRAQPGHDDPILRNSSRVTCAVGFGAQTTLDPDVILTRIGGNPSIHPCLPLIYDVTEVSEVTSDPRARDIMMECSSIRHASADDSPLYLIYGKAIPEGPYPRGTPISESIHSAKFGLLAVEALSPLGVECQLNYPGHEAPESQMEFLLRHLQVDRP